MHHTYPNYIFIKFLYFSADFPPGVKNNLDRCNFEVIKFYRNSQQPLETLYKALQVKTLYKNPHILR